MARRTELWIVVGFIALVAVGAIALAIFGSAAPADQTFLDKVAPALTDKDWQHGKIGADVSVIEYGDFQCPACGSYEPIVEQLFKEYGGRITFAFRNYPLPQHPNALIAAQAAEAAGLQGKYWEMHDLLYAKQTEWSEEATDSVVAKYFDGYAKQVGLDVAKFDSGVNSDAVIRKVQSDRDAGNVVGIDHTPTFFVNLREIKNPNSIDEFRKVIDSVLGSSTPATTTSQ